MKDLFEAVIERAEGTYVNGYCAEVEAENGFYSVDDYESYILVSNEEQSVRCFTIEEALNVIK